jgi:hypothetical protein
MLGSLFVPCQPTPVASLNTFYVFCVRFIVRESDFRFLRPGRAKLSQPQPQHTHLVIYHSSYVLYTFDHSDRDRQRAQHAEKNRFCCWLDPDLHKCHSIFSRTLDSCICRRSRLESKNLARVRALPNSKMHIHHYDICLSSITYVRLSKYSLRTS